jgi:hypothetical protein
MSENNERQPVKTIPRGIEVLVKKASVDTAFRELLLLRRAEAAKEIGLGLLPSEAAMVNDTPRAQLEAIIAGTHVEPRLRPALLGRVAAVMLVALGASTSDMTWAQPGPTTGSRPDPPEPVVQPSKPLPPKEALVNTVESLVAPTPASHPPAPDSPSTPAVPATPEPPELRGRNLWFAIAKGNVGEMWAFWSPEVILLPGSELLKQEYGMNFDDGRDKPAKVRRAALLNGYQKLIEQVGREKWQADLANVIPDTIWFAVVAKDAERFPDTKQGDVIMTVPTGPLDENALRFVLRQDPTDKKWRVVMEQADY